VEWNNVRRLLRCFESDWFGGLGEGERGEEGNATVFETSCRKVSEIKQG
jgi:hypothetical protein